MKEEIMRRLEAALAALNNIDVRGKRNLTNLANSIYVLEDAQKLLDKMDTGAEEPAQRDAEGQ